MDITKDLTISKTKKLLADKEVSCVELVNSFFDRIEEKDKSINAYLSLRKEKAIEEAKEIDRKINVGENTGPLGGVPIAMKDNILMKGELTTAASKILENYIAGYDATATSKIKKAGAIVLGKTNMDEFAMGSSTETSAFGITRNPLDETRSPGGSSGGSAVAVASKQAVVALGSDTAGSIRQPASFCGIVGMKPTYGAVSRNGLIALTSSLDQIGPLTNTVEDSAILFDVIRGKDKYDQTSKDFKFDIKIALEKNLDWKNIKIGVISQYPEMKMDLDLKESFKSAVSVFENLGANCEEINIKSMAYALPAYYIITPSEISSNLARYDGLRFANTGPDNNRGDNLHDLYFKHRGQKLGAEVKRRILLGTFALSAGYYDAYYKKAKKVQDLVRAEFAKVFEKFDIILSPTTPSTAFKIGEKSDPVSMYLSDIFTVQANITGLCAISLPIYGQNPLPYGLQIMAKPFAEEMLFKTALGFEDYNK